MTISRNLAGRLDLLEAELTPSKRGPVLTIRVTRVDGPDEIIEMRRAEPSGRRQRQWPPPRGAKDAI